jgi:hypothetical protein
MIAQTKMCRWHPRTRHCSQSMHHTDWRRYRQL